MNNWKDILNKSVNHKIGMNIVIIGKGASADFIDTTFFDDFVVINVNDSEKIYPGDVSVFHHEWVLNELQRVKPKCKLYITDRQLSDAPSIIYADFIPYDPDTVDFLLSRFFSNDLHIEHAILLSALKIANELGKLAKKRIKVYLIGFDFTTKKGWSRATTLNHDEDEPELLEYLISAQEQYLQHIMSEKNRLHIDIVHIGDKLYSLYSSEAFNNFLYSRKQLKLLSSEPVTAVNKSTTNVKIVAEITTNHFGDMERLQSMILAAKNAGADYIKLQKRDVDTFYSSEELSNEYKSPFGRTFRDYRMGLELTYDDFVQVDDFCKKIGIKWFVSILDYHSYLFMKQFEPELIKLPSTISNHREYLLAVGKSYTNDLVISTGFTDKAYEEFVLNNFKAARKIYLLQCTSAYPTRIEDAQIGVVRHYYNLSKKYPKLIPGYSSHDIGSLCSQMAVAAGALMIEKHVKFGSVSWAHFDEVAINLATDDFANFVKDIRLAERIVDSEHKKIRSLEHHKYYQNSSNEFLDTNK
jgi:sialic acid synthase SpsE